MKKKQGLRLPPSNPIGVWDQWTKGIAGNQVAREIISQGGLAIQTMVSPRGYMSASGELRGEKQVTPNHWCMPPQFERHAVMWHAGTRATNLRRAEVARDRRSVGGHVSTDRVLWIKRSGKKKARRILELRFLDPGDPKWIAIVWSRRTCDRNLCTSMKSEGWELSSLKYEYLNKL